MKDLQAQFAAAGRAKPEVVVLGGVSRDSSEAGEQLAALAALGVTRFVAGSRYETAAEFQRTVDAVFAEYSDTFTLDDRQGEVRFVQEYTQETLGRDLQQL